MEDRAALSAALESALAGRAHEHGMTVSPDAYSVLRMTADLRHDSSSGALGFCEGALDDALLATGLFERFDVTGKVLQVAPLENAGRVRM